MAPGPCRLSMGCSGTPLNPPGDAMRCLFLPDELRVFRPVAAAIRALQLQFVILPDPEPLPVVVARLSFDLVIAGVSRPDSPVLRLLHQHRQALESPVLGVAGEPSLSQVLHAAGADRVVVLPDQAAHLVTVMRALLNDNAR
jgi:hypothetical protein